MLNQPLLPLPRPAVARVRSVRRPFHPSDTGGRYRLPRAVQDRLGKALEPFRNRDAAWALATFLGRFWGVPARLVLAFPIDRRALADRADLDLTEGQIRGAIATLEAVGFLDRDPAPGSRYKPTVDGLHRKPIRFRFGAAAYLPAFLVANARSEASRGGLQPARRVIGHLPSPRPPVALIKAPLAASEPNLPKRIFPGQGVSLGNLSRRLSGGERMSGPPEPSPLETALARLGHRILLHPGAKSGGRS